MIESCRPNPQPTSGLSVGVVVIGRNEGERLVACLRSLAPLGLPVTYVDSASTDPSREVAQAAGAEVIQLDLSRPFTAARARNEGAAALLRRVPSLNYLQFIDGDCTVAADWMQQAVRFLDESPDYAVACGRRRERWPDASLYNQLADLEWATPVGDADACGGDALFRAEAYVAAGGFDPTIIAGEEPELCSRLRTRGWRVRRLDLEMTVHDAAMTRLGQWWGRAVRSGFGYAQAWRATRGRSGALYARELMRAIGWTLIPLALALLGAVLVSPILLLLAPTLYALQVVRMALRFGAGTALSWRRAALLTLGKAAETWGVLRYVRRALIGRPGGTIFYK